MTTQILGLQTVIYPAPNLAESKAYWIKLLGIEPYMDEPYYVGFNVGGYELGLLKDGNPAAGSTSYWGVSDVSKAISDAVAIGAVESWPASDVGNGITTGSVKLPDGNYVGFIHNPNFKIN